MKRTIHDSNVCFECIGDAFLRAEVQSHGCAERCSYCDHVRESLKLRDLAKRINCVINWYYQLTPAHPRDMRGILLKNANMWYREGNPIGEVIATVAGIGDRITEDAKTHLLCLPENQAHEKETGENPYGDNARYAEKKLIDLHYNDPWFEMQKEVRTQRRFFTSSAENTLQSIFDGLNDGATVDGERVIQAIGPKNEARFLWRARTAKTTDDVQTIICDPMRELGPPPSSKTIAGRMNPAGVPMFYGATDKSTAVSEVRPVVGSFVVLGKFEIIRKLRILDLDALTRVDVGDSFFDPQYPQRRSRAAFLKRFVREIGKPVLPEDEILGYLITQLIAEFFANKFAGGLDGIIYRSSQTDGDGRNLVLFNHARLVRSIDCTKLPTRVLVPEDANDDENERWKIMIDPKGINEDNSGETCHPHVNETGDQSQPTLSLDPEDVEIHSVTGVKYESELVNEQRF